MLIEEVDYLKQWLIIKLQSISEADPAVLAKYVIALLKKDDDFQQETFVDQLEVFLEDATIPFVRNLQEVIESKEYLPVPPKKKRVFTESPTRPEKLERKVSIENQNKAESGMRQPDRPDHRLVELSSSNLDEEEKLQARKRRFEDDRSHRKRSRNQEEVGKKHEYDDRRRGYNGREERGKLDDHGRDRYSRNVSYPKRRYSPEEPRRHGPGGGTGGSIGPRSPSPTLPHPLGPRRSRSPRNSPPRNGKGRRERCRDFDEKGYCLRGGLCSYDHGNDPVVVEESSLSSVLQQAQSVPTQPPPLPPHILPPMMPGLGAAIPPPPIFTPICPPGTEPYNPDRPGLLPIASLPLPPPPPLASATSNNTTITTTTVSKEYHKKPPYMSHVKRQTPSCLGQDRSFKLVDGSDIITGVVNPVEPDQKSLIITDIPYHSNNNAILSNHLGRYGPLKSLKCKVYNNDKTALVEYHDHASAVACFNSPDAIAGIKFIKVFWKEVIPISLASSYFPANMASAPKINENLKLVNSRPTTTTSENTVSVTNSSKTDNAKKRIELAKRTQLLIDQNIKNQKLVLEKMNKCKQGPERKALLETLKKLQESHATIKSTLDSTGVTNSDDRKRKTPAAAVPVRRTKLGSDSNLDLRPKDILVKNCNNAEELQEHFSKFGKCSVVPSGVGVVIGFDRRRDAEMAYVKGRFIENQELDIEWSSNTTVAVSEVAVEPIR